MLYKAYFSTFQSLCQVSSEDFSERLCVFPIRRIVQDLSNFARETSLVCPSFLTPLYSYEYTFAARKPPAPLQKTILRWENYVEFKEVPIAMVGGCFEMQLPRGKK